MLDQYRTNGTSSLKTYKGTVPALSTLVFDVVGSYVKLLATDYAWTPDTAPLVLTGDTGAQVEVFPGLGFRGDFKRLAFRNPFNVDQRISVQIGDGELIDTTVTGIVNIADGQAARTLANVAYSASPGVAAGAGVYPRIELRNSNNSGRYLIVERVSAYNTVVGGVNVYLTGAPVCTNFAALGLAKLSSGVTNGASLYSDTTASAPGGGGLVLSVPMPANTLVEVVKPGVSPIVLPPGQSMTLHGWTPNNALYPSIEWWQKAL